MINLKLLVSIDKQLQKARRSDLHSTMVFGGLPLVVRIENFYQFTPVLEKTL